jgi:hypothetical protein
MLSIKMSFGINDSLQRFADKLSKQCAGATRATGID